MYYDNHDVASVILQNREHPAVVEFFDRVADQLTVLTQERLTGEGRDAGDAACSEVSDYIVHWLSHLQMDTVLHVFSHELPRETSDEQLAMMIRFLRGGMTSLSA